MCLYPRLIKNRRYTETKKNGGIIPPVNDTRTLYVPIGCQICIECRKQKAKQWQIRLQEEIKENKNPLFITLTFSDENIKKLNEQIPEIKTIERINWKGDKTTKEKKIIGYTRDNALATKAIRLFLERWRKKYKKSVKHWLVTELGHNGTENIHLHGLIWTNESIETIKSIWQYGYIFPRNEKERSKTYVNEQTINYITKYIYKADEKHTGYNNIILTSPGIGNKYTKTTNSKQHNYKENGKTIETYRTRTGHKMSLPIYYRNKIYTDEEKEKLWIEKLNKEERYILGNKISIKEGEAEYYKALKTAQETNKRLGYHNPKIVWKKEKYEEERREIMLKKRINAGSGKPPEANVPLALSQ